MKKDRPYKRIPSAEYRFFLYDPEGDGMTFFRDKADRDLFAGKVIPEYCQDGWSEDVVYVCAGEVTHFIEKTNVIKRPPEDEIDEEGIDGDGNWWDSDWREKCNYELKEMTVCPPQPK